MRGLRILAAGCAMALTACAPATTSSSTTTTSAAGRPATTSPAARRAPTDPVCTRATKVKIAEDGFSPARLTVQRGGFLAVTNKSGDVRDLETPPGAGIVTSVVDPGERQIVQLPKTGVFTVRSADAALTVTVKGESGCGATESTLTIGAGAITPAELSLAATENFAVVNESGRARTLKCSNGDSYRVEKGETELLAIDEPGDYTCSGVRLAVR